MTSKSSKLTLIATAILSIAVLGLFTHKSLAEKNMEQECQRILEAEPDEISEDDRPLLRECLSYYQEESEKIESNLEQTAEKKQTLQNKINSLDQRIKNLNYRIYQNNLVIKDVQNQIQDTKQSIQKTSIKIQESGRKLIEVLRTIREQSNKTTVEILLSEDKLSGFFNNLVALEVLNSKNRQLLNDIKDLQSYLEEQEKALAEEKRGLENVVAIQRSNKQESEEMKQQQQRLKNMTEQQYQEYLSEKKETERKIENISTKLWETLVGARETPEYGEAVEVAQNVGRQTGVRAAFLLGILTQESRIGHNVGQCFLKDYNTGMGVKIETGEKWPRVMKPDRDVPIFREVVQKLNQNKNMGMDPKETLVSCWIPICARTNEGPYNYNVPVNQGNINCQYRSYQPYGYGGAMGPAQFIPSTWVNYQDQVSNITGETADPWNFSHAALASGLLLKANGADTQSRWAERRAAIRYLGADVGYYAENVLSLAECHQSYINTGSMSASCQEKIGLQ